MNALEKKNRSQPPDAWRGRWMRRWRSLAWKKWGPILVQWVAQAPHDGTKARRHEELSRAQLL